MPTLWPSQGGLIVTRNPCGATKPGGENPTTVLIGPWSETQGGESTTVVLAVCTPWRKPSRGSVKTTAVLAGPPPFTGTPAPSKTTPPITQPSHVYHTEH